MADEQELLDAKIAELTMRYLILLEKRDDYSPVMIGNELTYELLALFNKEMEAKLKALGYEQVWSKCPECDGRALKAREAERTGIIPEDVNVLPMDADCPTCKGKGYIIQEISEYRTPNEEDCPTCKGTGDLIKDAREQERKDIGWELQQWISKPHCTSSPYKFVARVMDAIALLHLGRALKGE